ncbi:DUF1080 domain-containing protein [Rhodohalobacter sp. 614A]|uniref:DUF1080 domain-containing protein n=1 Tax=Rhodohalobacter sp. 614A TaxID=2908649 RepID=UPI001F2EC5F8|nr:DUF1080 domain-containing protein [Rhodohalobacter sp. 614A]
MKKVYLFFLFIVLIQTPSFAQQTVNIDLNADVWDFASGAAEFIEYDSRPVLKVTGGELVTVKDFDFEDGTIEFDIQFSDAGFASFYFRFEDSSENECFYFRTPGAGNPDAGNAIQYAPTVKSVNLWDLMYHYQSNANYEIDQWNHVKLIVSGKQMLAYVNDMEHPALQVPYLEGDSSHGTLAFQGTMMVSNLKVRHDQVEGLSSRPGMDVEENDSRYIRKWHVTRPIAMEENVDFKNEYAPGDMTSWEVITAERKGLVNLTRKYGIKTDARRMVWLKTTIDSEETQQKTLRLGFSDEVWVTINGAPLYLDKNLFATPISKNPNGRLSLDNSTITIPLNKGKNELMIGVSNFFYGWGIVARFDDFNGIHLER